MNITKLKSGHYQIRLMEDGKKYCVTVDHKPSQTEALKLISERVQKSPSKYTLETACVAYIDSKSNLLSPSTIRSYKGLIKSISEGFKATPITRITKPMLQTEINAYSKDRSPKSARNFGMFLTSVLAYYEIEITGLIYPQKEKKSPYIPTQEEVKKIFAEVKNSKYEVPIALASLGLRRSEICALIVDDLEGNVLTINKAKVQGYGEQWHVKATKTTDSTRTVVIPDYLANLIRQQGYVYKGYPSAINQHLHKVQDSLGIERFPLHKLRHFFASYMHDLGCSDKQIQEVGGWKSNSVLKTVYTHAMELDEAKKKISDNIGALF